MKFTTYTSLRQHSLFAAALAAATLGTAAALAQSTPNSNSSPTYTPGRSPAAQQSEDLRANAAPAAQTNQGTYGGTTNPVPGRDTIPTHPDATDYSTSNNPAAKATDPAQTAETLTPTGRMTVSSEKLGWMERRWITKTADAGTTEVELAELATEQATNPDVKKYAQMLVDAHTKVNDELKGIATAKGVTLETDDLGSDRAYKRLSKKTDMEFDREFVEHMIDSHEDSIKRFEKASADAKDADLRAFAAKHVDHLREHLAKAETLRTTIMPTGRVDTDIPDTTGRALDNSDTSGRSLNNSDTSTRNRDTTPITPVPPTPTP